MLSVDGGLRLRAWGPEAWRWWPWRSRWRRIRSDGAGRSWNRGLGVGGAFLDYLEVERHNSVRTRNNRLAAIHSLFAHAAPRHPEHAAMLQRVRRSAKRTER